MPRINCTLPNASTNINGYAFRRVSVSPTEGFMQSVDVLPDDVAADLLAIPGYALAEEEPYRIPKQNTANRPEPAAMRGFIDAALGRLPAEVQSGEYADPDYVVRQMRAHFGDAFTTEDEMTVHKIFVGHLPKTVPAPVVAPAPAPAVAPVPAAAADSPAAEAPPTPGAGGKTSKK